MAVVEEMTSDRRDREVVIPQSKGSQITQTIREISVQVNGAKIFNSLPKSIRNMKRLSIDEFKFSLDKYLETLPDEPKLPNYTPATCNQLTANPSNSIIDHGRSSIRRPG